MLSENGEGWGLGLAPSNAREDEHLIVSRQLHSFNNTQSLSFGPQSLEYESSIDDVLRVPRNNPHAIPRNRSFPDLYSEKVTALDLLEHIFSPQRVFTEIGRGSSSTHREHV